jgi:N-methylhydantoinase A
VTDADVVLGFIDPDRFAGGTMRLDKKAAETAIGDLARQLGLSIHECASGITKIVEFHMADIIRKMTVGKGLDPRDFALFAFGGAGPLHAGVFARELGVRKVIIPQGRTASTWCAFGAASAEILHIYERVDISATPLDFTRVNRTLKQLGDQARRQLAADGIEPEHQLLQFSIDMRHKGQINEVEVMLAGGSVTADCEPDLRERFYQRYEKLYGGGSSLQGSRLEVVTFRVRASAHTPRPHVRRAEIPSADIAGEAVLPSRSIYWDEKREIIDTRAFDGTHLLHGNRILGPAIVETPDTTVVVRPGQALTVDTLGNFELSIGAAAGTDQR